MNNELQQLIAQLSSEYRSLNDKIKMLRNIITDLDFEEHYPDSQERLLMEDQLRTMEIYQSNLHNRIKFHRDRYKRGKCRAVGVIGDTIADNAAHHCGQDVRVQYDPNESQPVNLPVHGDDFDDACCQAREKCSVGDGSAVVNETPNSLKSLEGMQVIKVCGPKCKDCPCGDGLREYPSGRDASSCVKVELVGGYYLCLAQLPNSIVTE